MLEMLLADAATAVKCEKNSGERKEMDTKYLKKKKKNMKENLKTNKPMMSKTERKKDAARLSAGN